jgi:hypothetical protein
VLGRPAPGPTDWRKLLEPLPFFEGFKHFLQVGAAAVAVATAPLCSLARRSMARFSGVIHTACVCARWFRCWAACLLLPCCCLAANLPILRLACSQLLSMFCLPAIMPLPAGGGDGQHAGRL